jgi:hypothetical protein
MFIKILDWFLRGLLYRIPILRKTFLKRILTKVKYYKVMDYIRKHYNLKPNLNSYFQQNTERINKIADLLADKKSKDIYLGLIKYYQSARTKDHPFTCMLKGAKDISNNFIDNFLEEEQYYLKELEFSSDEVYIDCGLGDVYKSDGFYDTIDAFIRHCPEYKSIVAFEPIKKIYEKAIEKYKTNSKIKIINTGVSHNDGGVSFLNNTIQVKAIDNLNIDKVTFIKMDIEGAELSALKGTEKTILRDKPKLAICIYHSRADMIDIPEYIHKLVPEYKLYVRQYNYLAETVLYALLQHQ